MATVVQPNVLPTPSRPWFDPSTGLPSKEFALYMLQLDATIRLAFAQLAPLAGGSFLTTAGGQTITGGFEETEFDLGTPTNGATITPNPLDSLKQKVTNDVAGFTIDATTQVGDIELRIINGASAGTITLSGFDKIWTGDPIDTTSGHQFMLIIYGFSAKKACILKALQ